jgi:hypothetical protein
VRRSVMRRCLKGLGGFPTSTDGFILGPSHGTVGRLCCLQVLGGIVIPNDRVFHRGGGISVFSIVGASQRRPALSENAITLNRGVEHPRSFLLDWSSSESHGFCI